VPLVTLPLAPCIFQVLWWRVLHHWLGAGQRVLVCSSEEHPHGPPNTGPHLPHVQRRRYPNQTHSHPTTGAPHRVCAAAPHRYTHCIIAHPCHRCRVPVGRLACSLGVLWVTWCLRCSAVGLQFSLATLVNTSIFESAATDVLIKLRDLSYVVQNQWWPHAPPHWHVLIRSFRASLPLFFPYT
jgi:hypothetical protein